MLLQLLEGQSMHDSTKSRCPVCGGEDLHHAAFNTGARPNVIRLGHLDKPTVECNGCTICLTCGFVAHQLAPQALEAVKQWKKTHEGSTRENP
jgi:hypothetical protein